MTRSEENKLKTELEELRESNKNLREQIDKDLEQEYEELQEEFENTENSLIECEENIENYEKKMEEYEKELDNKKALKKNLGVDNVIEIPERSVEKIQNIQESIQRQQGSLSTVISTILDVYDIDTDENNVSLTQDSKALMVSKAEEGDK